MVVPNKETAVADISLNRKPVVVESCLWEIHFLQKMKTDGLTLYLVVGAWSIDICTAKMGLEVIIRTVLCVKKILILFLCKQPIIFPVWTVFNVCYIIMIWIELLVQG